MFPNTFCFIFVISVVLQANGSPLNNSNTVLIVEGEEVNITDYPYQVLVYRKVTDGYVLCGGSIIGNEYILTAAHCLSDSHNNGPVANITVRVGSSYASSGGEIYSISKKFVHPKYHHDAKDYDVGVLKTSKKMTIDDKTSKIVKMADSKSSLGPGKNVVVTGWGCTQINGSSSEVLRAVTLPVVSWEYCKGAFQLLGVTITKRMLCAGLDEGKSICPGDSGGPVVDEESGVQYGISSFLAVCGKFPSVYTFVPAVRDWIYKVTGI